MARGERRDTRSPGKKCHCYLYSVGRFVCFSVGWGVWGAFSAGVRGSGAVIFGPFLDQRLPRSDNVLLKRLSECPGVNRLAYQPEPPDAAEVVSLAHAVD
jgi:hypothetical protein